MSFTLQRSGIECCLDADVPALADAPTLCVVQVGFMGSTFRHMRRYASAWQTVLNRQRRFAVKIVTVLPPVSFVFNAGCTSDPCINGYGALLADLHEMLSTAGDQRVVMHLFSNAGAFLYEALVSELTSRTSARLFWTKVLTGIVFDSAPVDITQRAIKNATTDLLGGFGSDFAWIALRVLASQDLEVRRKMFAASFSHRAMAGVPRLFLFSRSDAVADAALIQQLALSPDSASASASASASSPAVSSYDFVVSGHVQHLQTFFKIYTDQLEQFLDALASPLPIHRSRL